MCLFSTMIGYVMVTVKYHIWFHYDTMNAYRNIKIPVPLTDIIDDLIKGGEYSSRAEYVKEVIRNDLRKRGLMQ